MSVHGLKMDMIQFGFLIKFTIIYHSFKFGKVAQSNQVQPGQCLLLATKSAVTADRENITYFCYDSCPHSVTT